MDAAFICFLTFGVSMITAAFVLSLTESTFNALVFAGLAVALVVVIDESVVTVENIRRRLQERGPQAEPVSRAAIMLEAAAEMRSPMGYATLILLLAALPVFFIEGISGSFFEPLVRVVRDHGAGGDGGGTHAHACPEPVDAVEARHPPPVPPSSAGRSGTTTVRSRS